MKKKTGNRPQAQISLLLQLFMAVMFLAGAAVFTYPFLADALSNYLDQRRIENYQKQLERDKEEKHEQQLAVHEKKNQTLAHTMEQDDRFYLEVYGRMLAYEVVEKIVVLPTKTNTLAIREKQDLVTLITCTPYTVNTHRLLVTGRRVPFTEEVSSKIEQTKKYHLYRLLILLLGILLVLTLFGYWCYRKFKRQKQLRKNNR
ncbi:sortase [Enterococcus faecium]|uniref:sortase n=1 Tax=Enterococcus faecium TaxID=1352 RepID=UPI0025439AFB|nr:sortase [Enterococcus faecium]EME7112967.1 sortase [Enterococcus faecium]MDK4346267.1 sortase [Enterococcus faecium]MDK4384653.1 sortase [Enterococcus faecium]HBK5274000.1 sortase [Enterococcus faecium]